MLLKDSIPAESVVSPANFTQPALILPQLQERETVGVIKELSQLLHQEGCVPDVLPFYNAALNREFLVNTAVESGMAFPPGRLSGQRQLGFALGRSEEPLVWGPRGAQPVRLVFLLAVPATDAGNYILLIGSLARLSRDLSRLERLHKARDSFEMFEVLKEVRLQSGRSPGGLTTAKPRRFDSLSCYRFWSIKLSIPFHPRLIQESSSTRDRLETTGTLTPQTAHDLDVAGIIGRASGFDRDLRRDFPTLPTSRSSSPCPSIAKAMCCAAPKSEWTKSVSPSRSSNKC